ncbi:bifunctional class I SAM-dependent methyltransferase/N-acetyltransferase [Streptomyces sp. NBC_01142]|uniref:bifunctional class I SAM-dependent methyltransferase/N-acetyltransferase n=1 Tax=Streptomyces sp. NBC_01142 TaxID=2975865 RepID=UPI002259141E|nr:bifunctional class I SAM-dependent methyltransferase/N-acetyltransferase [Streptomyces sp. NBC_01142]MCX4820688.1 bifunctional class I SAM-dependent methyltransferase/N-acetyltransferase [Streptomyces sp. NBC_01142]
MSDNALHDAFFALHHGLPRQGPGSDATTRRLLSLAGPLPACPRVLDLGCGPGRSALLLAAEAGAQVTAVDLHEPFLDELRQSAEALGLGDTIRTVQADMAELPFPDGSFDLVWAESSVYSIGFDTGLREWRRLLAPGGSLVLTECEWTAEDPSAQARDFWDQHYALRTNRENTSAAVAAGYTVLGLHRQPESDWDEYYRPLGERADAADAAAPGMAQALDATRAEIAMRREHGTEYGYSGYVLRPADPRWRTRPESAADVPAVRAVNSAAFPTAEEAGLVDALRLDGEAWLPGMSYVAEAPDGSVAAYALLTRCRVGDTSALALAPVATSPEHQRQGAGQAVVRAVLDAARMRGERLVLVLGHPGYYPKFGFEPASRYGIRPTFEVPDEAMMALVLDGCEDVPQGTIRYPAAFGI